MTNPNRMSKGERKGGRQKGTPNKVTGLLKEAILLAGEQAGNKVGNEGLVSYLQHQAEQNPVAYMTLLGKVLPLQVRGEISVDPLGELLEHVAKHGTRLGQNE